MLHDQRGAEAQRNTDRSGANRSLKPSGWKSGGWLVGGAEGYYILVTSLTEPC